MLLMKRQLIIKLQPRTQPAALVVSISSHIPNGLSLIDLFASDWNNTFRGCCFFFLQVLLSLITKQSKYGVIGYSMPSAELSRTNPKVAHILLQVVPG